MSSRSGAGSGFTFAAGLVWFLRQLKSRKAKIALDELLNLSPIRSPAMTYEDSGFPRFGTTGDFQFAVRANLEDVIDVAKETFQMVAFDLATTLMIGSTAGLWHGSVRYVAK